MPTWTAAGSTSTSVVVRCTPSSSSTTASSWGNSSAKAGWVGWRATVKVWTTPRPDTVVHVSRSDRQCEQRDLGYHTQVPHASQRGMRTCSWPSPSQNGRVVSMASGRGRSGVGRAAGAALVSAAMSATLQDERGLLGHDAAGAGDERRVAAAHLAFATLAAHLGDTLDQLGEPA